MHRNYTRNALSINKRQGKHQQMSTKIKGTVKFFSNTKGFGFITPENGDKDVFVHASQLDNVGGTLQEGQAVMFDSVRGKKGAEAQNVEMV